MNHGRRWDHLTLEEQLVLNATVTLYQDALWRSPHVLGYLRGRGLDQSMLYVDEANVRAVALYQNLGFARWSTDVLFQRG